jgi:hypothetical protein
LRERGFDFVAKINVNTRGGIGLLFHAAGSKAIQVQSGECKLL